LYGRNDVNKAIILCIAAAEETGTADAPAASCPAKQMDINGLPETTPAERKISP